MHLLWYDLSNLRACKSIIHIIMAVQVYVKGGNTLEEYIPNLGWWVCWSKDEGQNGIAKTYVKNLQTYLHCFRRRSGGNMTNIKTFQSSVLGYQHSLNYSLNFLVFWSFL